jgi:hypothetical protein
MHCCTAAEYILVRSAYGTLPAAQAFCCCCCRVVVWLQNPNVHGVRGKINTFRFDKETLERAGMGDAAGSNTPPFLVRTILFDAEACLAQIQLLVPWLLVALTLACPSCAQFSQTGQGRAELSGHCCSLA